MGMGGVEMMGGIMGARGEEVLMGGGKVRGRIDPQIVAFEAVLLWPEHTACVLCSRFTGLVRISNFAIWIF